MPFDALCLWCNYVWVQGVAGSFKRFSGAKAVLVRFGEFLGKKCGVVVKSGFFWKKGVFFLVRFGFFVKNGFFCKSIRWGCRRVIQLFGFLVRYGGFFGEKWGVLGL